jgi:Zn-finger nucleic acid-binding protein
MMFLGEKFCPHCGSAAAQWQTEGCELKCPGCQNAMLRGTLRDLLLHECSKCYGIWLDTVTFERICRDTESQAAVLGSAQPQSVTNAMDPVRYLRCPQCQELMNRVNFAHHSGVVVDVCHQHGTWFDRNELHRIVQFIRDGGLDQVRQREKVELEQQRRRLQDARTGSGEPILSGIPAPTSIDGSDLLWLAVGAAGSLIKLWTKR